MKRFAVLLLCVACTRSAAPEPSPSPSVVTTTAAPVPSTDLADGTTYGYLTALDTVHATVTVDVVQFVTGEAARWAEKGNDKDYFIRNAIKLLRVLRYAPDVTVVVNTLTAEETGSSTKDTTITPDRLKAFFATGEAQGRLFYVVLKNGVVTTIHEQYLP